MWPCRCLSPVKVGVTRFRKHAIFSPRLAWATDPTRSRRSFPAVNNSVLLSREPSFMSLAWSSATSRLQRWMRRVERKLWNFYVRQQFDQNAPSLWLLMIVGFSDLRTRSRIWKTAESLILNAAPHRRLAMAPWSRRGDETVHHSFARGRQL